MAKVNSEEEVGINNGGGRGWQNSSNFYSHNIVCKKSGHESEDCYFKCTRCKTPNHSNEIVGLRQRRVSIT